MTLPTISPDPDSGTLTVPTMRRRGIVVAIISGRGACPVEMVTNVAFQSWPTNTNLTMLNVYGMAIDEGRSRAVKEAISQGAKYIWFIDDDTVPPPDAGRQLLYQLNQHEPPNGKAMVTGGIYTTRNVPPEPLVFMGQGEGPFWNWAVGDVFKCWGLGTGCMLINLDLFQHLPEPWFKTITEVDFQQSDDLYFCERVERAGFEVWAHGGVLCHHYDLTKGTLYELPRNSVPYKNRNGSFSEPRLTIVQESVNASPDALPPATTETDLVHSNPAKASPPNLA